MQETLNAIPSEDKGGSMGGRFYQTGQWKEHSAIDKRKTGCC